MFLEENYRQKEKEQEFFIRSHNVEGQIEVDQSLEKKKKLKNSRKQNETWYQSTH